MLRKVMPIHTDPRGKWTNKYKGTYIMRKVFSRGALILSIMDGEDLSSHMNTDAVKKILHLKKRELDKLET